LDAGPVAKGAHSVGARVTDVLDIGAFVNSGTAVAGREFEIGATATGAFVPNGDLVAGPVVSGADATGAPEAGAFVIGTFVEVGDLA
jgi:hypothetical protein